ncbi:MAG: hypothetical protein NTY13_06185 [Chlamydiae bacterium]|nr:hypothetical protein [Chlamydiota bacterium]
MSQDLLDKAALVKSEDSEEKLLYCDSEAKAAVTSQMKQSVRKRFEEDLQKLTSALSRPIARKKYPKVLERLGRLKEKHKQISGCSKTLVVAAEDGTCADCVERKIVDEKMDQKLTWKYFLRTNLIEMNRMELGQLYNTLRGVEDAFLFMKSSLGMCPFYHQKENRVDGHLWHYRF